MGLPVLFSQPLRISQKRDIVSDLCWATLIKGFLYWGDLEEELQRALGSGVLIVAKDLWTLVVIGEERLRTGLHSSRLRRSCRRQRSRSMTLLPLFIECHRAFRRSPLLAADHCRPALCRAITGLKEEGKR
ncbi:hypothetical protein MRB53_005950 [Persea americana]|uniref:Uncharacterized protein n=1 Tax=Persea americana TaxID=3435 RepID=A0ACC2MEJ9_PERAE|nr:hypothetical protein MRB53_005950 [Persea americana]